MSRRGGAAAALVLLASAVAGCAGRRVETAPAAAPVPGGVERGLASWYGDEFAGLPTASGEVFRPELLTAAHRTLPLGTVVDVVNERNGRTVRVTVNDRGPFVAGRILDLSRGGAEAIGSVADGVVPVTLTVVAVGSGERRPPGPDGTFRGWAVQAGAFAEPANAERLKERLAERFPQSWLEEAGGVVRVKFGPYDSRAEAEEARASLDDLGLAGIVVPY